MCVEIRHLSKSHDTFQIPFLFSQCFDMFPPLIMPLENLWSFHFFCQHLILGFNSRQRKECKGFPELLFYLLSSYLSSTKLSSSPWSKEKSFSRPKIPQFWTTLISMKSTLFFCLWKYCFSWRSLAFNGFVKILVPSVPSYCRRAWGFTCS